MPTTFTEKTRVTYDEFALYEMVRLLSLSNLPAAIRNQSIVINEVPANLFVNIDENKLAAVIGQLLQTVLLHTQQSRIRITAKRYGNVMLMHIRDSTRLNSPAFASSLVDIQQMAEKIQGNVSVTSYRNRVTTIALSFITNF